MGERTVGAGIEFAQFASRSLSGDVESTKANRPYGDISVFGPTWIMSAITIMASTTNSSGNQDKRKERDSREGLPIDPIKLTFMANRRINLMNQLTNDKGDP